ncbi:MAG: DUF1775 domain-containing protein [Actinocrinis sp.]
MTISPDTAAHGGSDVQMTFRVPNEESCASTTRIQIAFPTDHPIASVLVQPVPGWTAKIDNTALATPIHTDDGDISQVTWSGGHIAPGQGIVGIVLGILGLAAAAFAFTRTRRNAGGDETA